MHHKSVLLNGTPKTWSAWANNINDNLRLAYQTEDAKMQVTNATSALVEQIKEISCQHYDQILADAINEVNEKSHLFDRQSFALSLSLVEKWASKQLPKLNSGVRQEAVSILQRAFDSNRPMLATKATCNRSIQTDASPFDNLFTIITLHDNIQPDDNPTTRPAVATSKKTVKKKNPCRFFIHCQNVAPSTETNVQATSPMTTTTLTLVKLVSHLQS